MFARNPEVVNSSTEDIYRGRKFTHVAENRLVSKTK